MKSLAAVTLLSIWFLGIAFLEPRINYFQYDSELLLIESAESDVTLRGWSAGGFMTIPKELETEFASGPYFSQFGLHYQAYSLLARAWPFRLDSLNKIARVAQVLLLSFVLVWFARTVERENGRLAWLVVLCSFFLSYPLILFASKIYWCLFLSLAPFVFSFSVYGRIRRMIFLGSVFMLIFVKSLCGYEYLTCITLSVGVAVLHRELDGRSSMRSALRRAATSFLVACSAFVPAFAVHYAQAVHFLGDRRVAWSAITRSARLRLAGDFLNEPISLRNDLGRLFDFILYDGQATIAILAFGSAAALSKVDAKLSRRWLTVLAAAYAASLSWNFIVLGHMRYHRHINFICYYIPFNLMVFAFFGSVVGLLGSVSPSTGRRDRP